MLAAHNRELRKRMYRLLISTSDKYPPYRVDVTELFRDGLATRGFVIDWVMERTDEGPSETIAGEHGQRFIVFGNDRLFWLGGRLRRVARHLRRHWAGLRLAMTGNYDAVQVRDLPLHGIFYLLAARLGRKKFVYWMSFPYLEGMERHARDEAGRIGRLNSLARLFILYLFRPVFYHLVLAHADHVFVQSEEMRRFICAQGVALKHATPVPMGVNVEKFNPDRIVSTDDPRTTGRKVLVYMGSIEAIRQVDILVRALAVLVAEGEDAVLFVLGIGGTEDAKRLMCVAQQSGVADRLFLTGQLPLAEALRYVARADVCLSPCPRDPLLNMGTPTKLVEYLTMGRPVVANDHPDQEAILRASGAGICGELSPEFFASVSLEILRDPTAAAKKAALGPGWVKQNRSYDALLHLVEERYREMLSSSKV